MARFFLGLDSTDSLRGGCTTHVAALLIEMILELGGEFMDYPHLVRLNPNIPFKTRGNGAVSLDFRLDESLRLTMLEAAEELVTREADLTQLNSDPGLVLLEDSVPPELRAFGDQCLHEVVCLEDAEELLNEFDIYRRHWKLGRGLIGALAAIGLNLPPDYIFELVAYRQPQNRGTPRLLDPDSVRRMDAATRPNTLNNIDDEAGRVLITPRGPDPVLFGIRGESPQILAAAFRMLTMGEEVERWVIFRSNECTDSHLRPVETIAQLKPHTPAILHGTVATKPRIIRGGHVFVTMTDETGIISLAAYEPTGRFRQAVASLMPGDHIIAAGGVMPSLHTNGLALNLESLKASELVQRVEGNPPCPSCNRRTESVGSCKGYRCRRCRRRFECFMKDVYAVSRSLEEGTLYQPPPRAHRHLTKPLSRRPLLRDTIPPDIVPEWCSFLSDANEYPAE